MSLGFPHTLTNTPPPPLNIQRFSDRFVLLIAIQVDLAYTVYLPHFSRKINRIAAFVPASLVNSSYISPVFYYTYPLQVRATECQEINTVSQELNKKPISEFSMMALIRQNCQIITGPVRNKAIHK